MYKVSYREKIVATLLAFLDSGAPCFRAWRRLWLRQYIHVGLSAQKLTFCQLSLPHG